MNRTIVFLLVLVLIASACSAFPAQQVVSYQPGAILMMQNAKNLAAFIAPAEGGWAWGILTVGAPPSLVMQQISTVAVWRSLEDVIAHLSKLGYVRVPLEAAPAAVVTVEAALLCLRMIGTIPLMVPADQLHPFAQEGIDG